MTVSVIGNYVKFTETPKNAPEEKLSLYKKKKLKKCKQTKRRKNRKGARLLQNLNVTKNFTSIKTVLDDRTKV